MEPSFYHKYVNTPVGRLTLICTDKGLAAVLWEDDYLNRVHAKVEHEDDTFPILVKAERQLNEYFEGKRTQFELTFDPIGTDFQKEVWQALSTIPFGQTRSYLDIAHQISNPKAVRAVGGANHRNPLSIVVPCHRVIGANGALTGFAGGLGVKTFLLSLEGIKKTNPQIEMPLYD